jgi:tetratricopeptide (TPR) repeat protein
LTDFDKATHLDSKRARAWHFRGIANVQRRQYDEAVSDFSSEIELKPHDVKAHFNRGEVYLSLGKFESAIADYGQVLAADSGDLEALTGRAHCHYAMAHFEQALSDYDSIVQLCPNNAMALVNRADAHQMLGQWKQAYDDYLSSVAIEPLGVGYQKWAWMMATCPEPSFLRPEEASKLCQRAIELDGETPANLDTRAAAEAAMGNFEVAKQLQHRAIALADSEDKEMQARMAMYQQGQIYKQASAAHANRR